MTEIPDSGAPAAPTAPAAPGFAATAAGLNATAVVSGGAESATAFLPGAGVAPGIGFVSGFVTPTCEPPGKKRSISTPNLFAAATLVAVLGGTIAGYAVQAARADTPQPSFRVAQPLYPAAPVYGGVTPASLPAAEDDGTIVDGDLTRLLLPTPKGASIPSWGVDHSWYQVAADAQDYQDPASQFENELLNVRRIADTSWTEGGVTVEIRITQYLPGSSQQAYTAYQNSNGDGTQVTVPANVTAQGSQYSDSSGKGDYVAAPHGDLLVEFWVEGTHSYPGTGMVDTLISQQMARL